MQNVSATSNKRSMKNNQNPATAHHTIMTARRPDNICSSILVRGRSIRSMARSCRWLRRPLPRKDSHFYHFGGVFTINWCLDQDILSHTEGGYVRILAESSLWEGLLGKTRIRTTEGLTTCMEPHRGRTITSSSWNCLQN